MNGEQLKELLDTVSEKVRKETAKEIMEILKGYFYEETITELLDAIAKQCGIEIKE